MKKNNLRLKNNVLPKHYAITLKPDLLAHTFSGHETITVLVEKNTNSIELHSKELNIRSAFVLYKKQNISAQKISYDIKRETAVIDFASQIPKGVCKLSIIFDGILSDNMRGFYKSQYIFDGKERFIATTQFEATDARRAFPCFDEPKHKAVFDVNLIVPDGKMAISNTLPVAVIEHEVGYKMVSFASTPKMSTYLLAFIVGEFEWLEAKTKNAVLVRVVTVPGKSHQAKFALDVTVKCLEFYEEYFDIKYPLNTLDMIAIPDFASLAMENWGAITFREVGLLVDEKNTSKSYKQMVALVIAHELAHQWFGNLVTMEWWTHLWLNEGFATYIEHLAVAELFPEYEVWKQFIVSSTGHGLSSAMQLDGLLNTHPIEVDVHNPNEIGEIFDAVSYAKGAVVIRMLAEYLGYKDFRAGLRYYLKKHSYKNANTIHLWEAFEKVSKKPVKKIMSVWTKKSGYPVVSVSKKGDDLHFVQKRFFSNGLNSKRSKDSTIWPIPLQLLASNGEHKISLMTKKSARFSIKNIAWYKLNPSEKSLYRTCYDNVSLLSLSEQIKNKSLSSEDRLGIIRDAISFACSGEMKTENVLKMFELYKYETEYIVWVEIVSGLYKIAHLLYGTKNYPYFKTYAQGILKEVINFVGWNEEKNESENKSLMRPLILSAASFFEESSVICEAQRLFLKKDFESLKPDIRGVVYVTAVREGDEDDFAYLVRTYENSDSHEERERILFALGKAKDKNVVKKGLEYALSENVRLQDRNRLFVSVLGNPFGKVIAWNFIKKNWSKISSVYGEGNHLISRILLALSSENDSEIYKDIKDFFKMHQALGAERTVLQALENIEANVLWLKRDKDSITSFLRKNNALLMS